MSQDWTVTLYALAVKKSPAVSEMKRYVLPINLCPYTCFRVIWWDTGCYGLSVCLSVCSQFLVKKIPVEQLQVTSLRHGMISQWDLQVKCLRLEEKVRVTAIKKR